MRKIYLASTSPRRRDLMNSLHIPYEMIAPKFDEAPTSYPPGEECLFFAEQKALSVREFCHEALILGCDTMIELSGEKLGKPRDENHAALMLGRLSGRSHRVLTAVVLLDASSGKAKRHLEETRVAFRTLEPKEIKEYVATGEPMDKAGAYAVQGKAREFIVRIEGDEESVIGLPLKIVRAWLEPLFPKGDLISR